MKRRSEYPDLDEPRKFGRLNEQGLATARQLQAKSITNKIASSVEIIHSVYDEYINYRPFASSCSYWSEPYQNASAISQTVQEIDELLKGTKAQIEAKYFQLRSQKMDFMLSTMGIPDAYGSDNLLSRLLLSMSKDGY